MDWLNNTLTLGASSPSFQIGAPLVTGDIGNAQYAQPSQQGFNWGGLLGAAAQGLSPMGKKKQQQPVGHVDALQFGERWKNPGATAFSGLLASNVNRGGM
jgi:hypothetical protein